MTLAVVPLAPAHVGALRTLFARIQADPQAHYFHPHPFTVEEAQARAAYAGRDCYLLLMRDSAAVGYGFLRGWDDGYAVPSLGIYVADECRGTGAAALLMAHLHRAAAARGATRVRLKVHPDNVPARRLYERLGYVFGTERDGGELVGMLNLAAAQ